MEFYQKLQTLRKNNGMSQEDLATHLNVSRQAVSKWENGQGYPETDKLLQLSSLYGVSVDYLLKDEPVADDVEQNDDSFYANRETVDAYLLEKRQSSKQIALGVAVLLLSLIWYFIIPVESLGLVLFLLNIAAGVAILVLVGFRPKRYSPELEKRRLTFDASYLRELNNQYQIVRKNAGVSIVMGIVVVLLGVASQVLIEDFAPVQGEWYVAVLFLFLAIGVPLIIVGGARISAWGMLVHNEEHIKEIKDEDKSGWLYGVTMPLAAMAFLCIGFLTGYWHPGWLVFPVTAIVTTGIVAARRGN